jgi:plasmid stabilization system protein ParE
MAAEIEFNPEALAALEGLAPLVKRELMQVIRVLVDAPFAGERVPGEDRWVLRRRGGRVDYTVVGTKVIILRVEGLRIVGAPKTGDDPAA